MVQPPLVVVMGISGVGKSAVGHELADRFGLEYADGDDFHSEANDIGISIAVRAYMYSFNLVAPIPKHVERTVVAAI